MFLCVFINLLICSFLNNKISVRRFKNEHINKLINTQRNKETKKKSNNESNNQTNKQTNKNREVDIKTTVTIITIKFLTFSLLEDFVDELLFF